LPDGKQEGLLSLGGKKLFSSPRVNTYRLLYEMNIAKLETATMI
jgi:hypothetical protein